MKNFKHILASILLTVSVFATITYTSCNGDKCGNVECKNGGSCNDGSCTCPTGYKGDLCEIPPGFCDLYQCQNGGTCENGACTCLAGYEGVTCENEVRAKFIGTYTCVDKVTGSPMTVSYVTQIQAGDQLAQVRILNFANQFTQPVIATVSGKSVSVDLQSPDGNGKTIQAAATINPNDGSLEWIYQIKNSSNVTIDCEGVWDKN